ncbi:MAG TPA: hypothetical protein VHT26_23930 [Trebonia sp.]|nr:hypothetical protein [Trebonia sp.]
MYRSVAGRTVFLLVLAVLFAAYLRLSKTYPENSDEANILLMASDLAHGNLYLSGWNVSDVPFITTELPEIALLVRLFGLHLDTAHIAAALTYTVVVAIAVLLAKGRASGPRAIARMGIALAIMLAPQPGVGVFVLVFSVGHIGTAAPVMLTWLVLDRCWPAGDAAGRTPRRLWFLPAAVALLLAWALMADPLVLVIAVCPVLVVAGVRLVTGFITELPNEGVLRRSRHVFADRWLEASLAAAAGLAYLIAWGGGKLLRAAGGYAQQPVPFTLDPVSTWYAHSLTAAHGLLEMFGAFFLPGTAPPLSGLAEAVAVTRLACVAIAVLGACAIARRFFRRDADLVSQLLLAGIIANLAAYIPSSLADHTALNAREFAPVLPFAAVLAARMLGDRTAERAAGNRIVAVSLAAVFCWYCAGLAHQAAAPAAADPFARLETFLRQQHLTEGIGGYWDSSVITVDTDGAISMRAVTGCLHPYAWESKPAWYDPAGHAASFVLESGGTGYFSRWLASPAALRRLGGLLPAASPATLDPGDGYAVHAFQGNLLTQLPLIRHC